MSESPAGLRSQDLRRDPGFYQVHPDNRILDETISKLGEVVFGQEKAVAEVAKALTRAKGGFISPNRPYFIGLFLGPPGTGKTEMGKAIAKLYHNAGWERYLKIVDCAKYQQEHDVFRITGAPPSYVGYGDRPVITPDLLVQPNVIVFDEIEKAHRALHDTLLNIFDKGKLEVPISYSYLQARLTELNFANSIIILTSNAGSEEMENVKKGKVLDFPKNKKEPLGEDIHKVGIKAIRDRFKHRPEFIDRIDSIVVFDRLSRAVHENILDKFLAEYNQNQHHGQNELDMTLEAKTWLLDQSDPSSGGRELKRALDRLVMTPAAQVKATLAPGVRFTADIDPQDNSLVFFASKESVVKKMPITQTPPKSPEPIPEKKDRAYEKRKIMVLGAAAALVGTIVLGDHLAKRKNHKP